jgi:hypothetical protein
MVETPSVSNGAHDNQNARKNSFLNYKSASGLTVFEIALVLVRFDHSASVIVNADHGEKIENLSALRRLTRELVP